LVALVLCAIAFATTSAVSAFVPQGVPQNPVVSPGRGGELYAALHQVDSLELVGATVRERSILNWLDTFAGPRNLVITRENLPYVTLGAIRDVYMHGQQQWFGNGLLEALLARPDRSYWHQCSYLVQMFTQVMDTFDIAIRPLQHFRREDYTHATCEFYSVAEGDWVYVDVLYGAVFIAPSLAVASYADIAHEMSIHGSNLLSQGLWSYEAVRYYSTFDTAPVVSPVQLVDDLDKRDYGVVVERYFALTAIRYDDVLYHSPASRPIANPISPGHLGRWLVIDLSADRDIDLLRYDGAFWSWFHERYHLNAGGSYTYEVLRLADQRARVERAAPASRVIRRAQAIAHGNVLALFDAVPLPQTRLFSFQY